MLESNNNLKAVILYRVSTDRQDESLQVNICQSFCKNHNMDIVEEYREIDVSGFKTPLAKRYELLKILNRAEIKKDFDVLVVYLHDRLGRREDETPQVVQNLFKNGVRCFDAHNNSEIKVESHT
ncbi:MAG: recombinase family protein, partial [Bacillota bacterium]|nr:recombinase family protein [Bacillota bacterium]